ncbi:MAG TPA: hypothetical protein PK689_06640 [Kiritimatiellia bacterium]|nr:hypothetical protein [Kiritimatiellia bacterium]
MNPTGSEITTSQETPVSATGMQLGGHGLATRDVSRRAEEQPQGAVEWLKRSLPSLRHDLAAREMAAAAVTGLQTPASPAWVMARIAALLSPYYEKDVPQAVRVMEAEGELFEAELSGAASPELDAHRATLADARRRLEERLDEKRSRH